MCIAPAGAPNAGALVAAGAPNPVVAVVEAPAPNPNEAAAPVAVFPGALAPNPPPNPPVAAPGAGPVWV